MNAEILDSLRQKIERMDREIVRLLNERAAVSIEIGRSKLGAGREIYDSSREAMVYRQLADCNGGLLPETSLRSIFREIISASRALQAPMRVAFLGPEASFSHQAALAFFGSGIIAVPKATIPDVFDDVEREQNGGLGIVPVENSVEGSVKTTLDRLISTPLSIRAEVFLRIRHCLLSVCSDTADIRRIYSHPQALAQCQGWLRTRLPGVSLVEMASTAGAALRVLKDKMGAAVGSRLAAETYGLNLLEAGIEDNPANTTRFLIVGPKAGSTNEITGRDKTSILFGTPHVPGALQRALAPFAEAGINLTRIESCPMRDRMWEYLFFVDFVGHIEEEKTRACLQDLEKQTATLKILGSYPQGMEPSESLQRQDRNGKDGAR
ncbi:MAG: prephenate dehydratase [Deltaproteobacteria bacterium]|nr:prephenate dehydratase [Deltaproteobacteria bacterium]